MFLAFEGNEYTGKSTQVSMLANRLRQDLRLAVLKTREPGGTEAGEACRQLLKHSNGLMSPETELLLMNASRAQLVHEVILPALKKNEIVIADRFSDSSVAYQGFGRGLSLEMVHHVIQFATGGLRPDFTFLLTASEETRLERKKLRAYGMPFKVDRFEDSDRKFFEKVDYGYAILLEQNPKMMAVDANGPAEVVHEKIWAKVLELLR